MLRAQLELEPPNFCLLGQAVLWLHQPGEPILDYRLHEDVIERDLAHLDKDRDPFGEYESEKEALFIALKEGMIGATGLMRFIKRDVGTLMRHEEIGWDEWGWERIDWKNSRLLIPLYPKPEDELKNSPIHMETQADICWSTIEIPTVELFDVFKISAVAGGVIAALGQDRIRDEIAPARNPSPQPERKRGRPPAYDWDAFYIEVIRIANTSDGLPTTQSELERKMAQWFVNRYDKEPGETTLKDRVRRIYKHVRGGGN